MLCMGCLQCRASAATRAAGRILAPNQANKQPAHRVLSRICISRPVQYMRASVFRSSRGSLSLHRAAGRDRASANMLGQGMEFSQQ